MIEADVTNVSDGTFGKTRCAIVPRADESLFLPVELGDPAARYVVIQVAHHLQLAGRPTVQLTVRRA